MFLKFGSLTNLYFLANLTPLFFGFFGSVLCTLYLNEDEQGVFLILSFVTAQSLFEGGMYFQIQQKLAKVSLKTGSLVEEKRETLLPQQCWLNRLAF